MLVLPVKFMADKCQAHVQPTRLDEKRLAAYQLKFLRQNLRFTVELW